MSKIDWTTRLFDTRGDEWVVRTTAMDRRRYLCTVLRSNGWFVAATRVRDGFQAEFHADTGLIYSVGLPDAERGNQVANRAPDPVDDLLEALRLIRDRTTGGTSDALMQAYDIATAALARFGERRR